MFEPQNADVMKRYAIVCGARDAKRGLRLRMITGFKCVKVKRYMIQVWQRCCRRGGRGMVAVAICMCTCMKSVSSKWSL